MKEGYTTRTNKYKKNPFRPQPRLRVDPKSRRHHPVSQGEYCPRQSRCGHRRRCSACIMYSEFKEKGK
jgi:hypothetical protein